MTADSATDEWAPVSRDCGTPLWVQVREDLDRRCAEGRFASGVPGEFTLSRQYGVSRHTVREALRGLREDGVIRSRRGRGSTVAAAAAARVEVVDAFTGHDEVASGLLGLPADADLEVVRQVIRADGETVAVQMTWRPLPLVAGA